MPVISCIKRKKARVGSGLPVICGLCGRLSCGGHGLGELRDDAELLHQALSIPVDVAFDNLAVRNASDGDAGNVDLFPGGRNAVELAFVSTAARPAGHDGFAFGNDILDRQVKVGEGRTVESCSFLFAVGAAPKIGRGGIVMRIVGAKDLIGHREIAGVPKFREQTTNDSFIVF